MTQDPAGVVRVWPPSDGKVSLLITFTVGDPAVDRHLKPAYLNKRRYRAAVAALVASSSSVVDIQPA